MAGNIMNFIVAFLVLNLQSGVYCHTTSVVPYVIGSVIGCVVLVKVIVIGIICCRRKSRQNTLEVSEEGEARKEKKRWEKEDKAPLSGSGPNVYGGGFGFTGGDSGRGFGKDGGDKGLARGYSHEDEQSLGFGHKGGDTGRGYRNSIDYYRSNSIASAGSGGVAAH